jgi:hypothetical protein
LAVAYAAGNSRTRRGGRFLSSITILRSPLTAGLRAPRAPKLCGPSQPGVDRQQLLCLLPFLADLSVGPSALVGSWWSSYSDGPKSTIEWMPPGSLLPTWTPVPKYGGP